MQKSSALAGSWSQQNNPAKIGSYAQKTIPRVREIISMAQA